MDELYSLKFAIYMFKHDEGNEHIWQSEIDNIMGDWEPWDEGKRQRKIKRQELIIDYSKASD